MQKDIRNEFLKALAERGNDAYQQFVGVAYHANGDEIGEFNFACNQSVAKGFFKIGFGVRVRTEKAHCL